MNSFLHRVDALLLAGAAGSGHFHSVLRVLRGMLHPENKKDDSVLQQSHQRVYKISDFNGVGGRFFYGHFPEKLVNESRKYNAKTSVDSVRRDMITKADVHSPYPYSFLLHVPQCPPTSALPTPRQNLRSVPSAHAHLLAETSAEGTPP